MSIKLDSCDKITEYLERLEIGRHNISLGPSFFRSFNCPEKCGACCQKFSLDYITVKAQKTLQKFYPEIYRDHFRFREYNNRLILSNFQEDNFDHHCQFLDENARCKIHEANPLSCQVEPIKFRKTKNQISISKQFFGRGWNMTRVDGEKGCLCEFIPYSKDQHKKDIQILRDLNDVADVFEIETVLPQVVDLLKKLGPDVKLKNKIPIQIVGMNRLDEWI